jgi:hypothetical protein
VERGTAARRLPRADGTRLRLTEYFQFILDLAAADSNLAHSLRNHYVVSQSMMSPMSLMMSCIGNPLPCLIAS